MVSQSSSSPPTAALLSHVSACVLMPQTQSSLGSPAGDRSTCKVYSHKWKSLPDA